MQTENDARMARSLACANITDAEAIKALRLNDGDETDLEDSQEREVLENEASPVTNDLRTLSKLAGRYVSLEAGILLLTETRTRHAWRVGNNVIGGTMPPKSDCAACGDSKQFFEVMELSCGHAYCRECVESLFLASFKDETLFPPRCCRRPLIEQNIDIFLTREIRDTFREKEIEFATDDRTYCYYKRCSNFIPPNHCDLFQGYARCQKCPRLTCLECKQRYHAGATCPVDKEKEVILDLAQQAGWQRCRRCQTMIELHTGCNHITCKCTRFVTPTSNDYTDLTRWIRILLRLWFGAVEIMRLPAL